MLGYGYNLINAINYMLDARNPAAYIQYTTTQRGRIMLIYNGYRYVENRQSHKNVFWRCSRYVKYGCRATVVTSKTDDDISIRVAGSPHTHVPELKTDTLTAIAQYELEYPRDDLMGTITNILSQNTE